MVTDILTAAGVPHRRTRYTSPPTGAYAVYMDDITTDGPDGHAVVLTHDITVELYTTLPDDVTEAAVEAAITAAGLQWTRQDRAWIQTEQLYQTIYEFTYTEKRRLT